MGLSYGNVIVREGLLGDHNLTPSTTIKGFIIMVDCAFKGHFFFNLFWHMTILLICTYNYLPLGIIFPYHVKWMKNVT